MSGAEPKIYSFYRSPSSVRRPFFAHKSFSPSSKEEGENWAAAENEVGEASSIFDPEKVVAAQPKMRGMPDPISRKIEEDIFLTLFLGSQTGLRLTFMIVMIIHDIREGFMIDIVKKTTL